MNEIIGFIKYTLKSKLLILGFLIYFLFNISALKTNWFDYFFFGSSIHYCCQGLDFYGIPNGVYSFIHGGDLSGSDLPKGLKPYSVDIVSNPNDYHPLIALVVGIFLIMFSPVVSFYLWMIVKIFITIAVVYYVYKNFLHNKYLNLAIFLFLINFSQYNEIRISQYQFIFNIFLLLFLINLVKNKSGSGNGVLYFLTLIAKPISLLLLPILIIKRNFLVAIVGISLFLISTISFNIVGVGQHFTNNLMNHLASPRIPDSIDFMSLDALMRRTFNLSSELIKYIKYIVLIGIYVISLSKKTNITMSIFLISVYFLFFYDHVFQYHFSILGPVLAICLLTLPEFQTKIARILILIINLPSVFFLLRIFNFQFIFDPVYGPNPTIAGWQIVSFFQILPILLLTIVVLIPQIHYSINKLRHRE